MVLPPEPGAGRQRRFTASIYAHDADLDLAFLHIGGIDVPYLALGDSDAMATGDVVQAVGYPFGASLELGRPQRSDAAPAPSISQGSISAFRADANGERRYIQVSAALNPGNSGGPIVDSEGYVIAVAQLAVEQAALVRAHASALVRPESGLAFRLMW